MRLLKKRIFLYVFIAVFLAEFLFSIHPIGIASYNYFLAYINPNFLLEMANESREAIGAGTLEMNAILEEAASMKAQDMAENGYFAHTSPDGITPWYWFKEAGYSFSYAGENLAVNFSDSEKLYQAWIDSPSHRENIINNNFVDVGIAMADGEYKGREATFVVQLFGSPAAEENILLEEGQSEPESLIASNVSPQQNTESPQEVLPAEESQSEVLGQEKTEEEGGDNYESFVAFVDPGNSETPYVVSSSLSEREEIKYTPLLSRIKSFFGNGVELLLFCLGLIVLTALSLKIFMRSKLTLVELVFNSSLVFLVAVISLYLGGLLIPMIYI